MPTTARVPRLHVPVQSASDVIPHLGKQELHWKQGYSARELVELWQRHNDWPPAIRRLLSTARDYEKAELVDGFFERQVALRSRGRPSQTDLLIVAGLSDGLAVIAVEGKVDEPFGSLVSEWNDGSPGKQARLAELCGTLGISIASAGPLRYQLLHRTASALYEAQRYRAGRALMIVHSFSARRRGFEDFQRFAAALDMVVDVPGTLSGERTIDDVALRLGWASDTSGSED